MSFVFAAYQEYSFSCEKLGWSTYKLLDGYGPKFYALDSLVLGLLELTKRLMSLTLLTENKMSKRDQSRTGRLNRLQSVYIHLHSFGVDPYPCTYFIYNQDIYMCHQEAQKSRCYTEESKERSFTKKFQGSPSAGHCRDCKFHGRPVAKRTKRQLERTQIRNVPQVWTFTCT